jgi:streptogramin lyase
MRTNVVRLAVTALLLPGCVAGRPSPPAPSPSPVSTSAPAAAPVPDPISGTDSVRVGAFAIGAGAVFAVDEQPTRSVLFRVDPQRHVGTRLRTFPLAGLAGLVVSGDVLWALADDGLLRLDPTTGRTLSRTAAPRAISRPLAADGAGGVWVLARDAVRHIDADGRLLRTVHVRLEIFGGGIGVGFGAVWVNAEDSRATFRIDLATGRVARLRLRHDADVFYEPGRLAVTDDAVWVTAGNDVARLDPRTGRVTATVRLGDVGDLTGVGGTVWAVGGARLYRIDSATAAVAGRTGVAYPSAVTADATTVWVASGYGVVSVPAAAVVGDLS